MLEAYRQVRIKMLIKKKAAIAAAIEELRRERLKVQTAYHKLENRG